MIGFVARRLLWMVPTLFGITLLTFAMLDVGPLDRAELELQRAQTSAAVQADDARRVAAVESLRARYGMVDEHGVERSFWVRYAAWLAHAARFDFATEGEDVASFRARFGRAFTVSLLLGATAIGLALIVGTWLGMRLGRHLDGPLDRLLSPCLLTLQALPTFLVASLCLLVFAGMLGWLPSGGLRDAGSAHWSLPARTLDLAAHLVLPVAVYALLPFSIVVRHVRDAAAHASTSEFVAAMRNWGASEREVDRAVARHAQRPLATLLGSMLPAAVTGSIVVEQTFGLPGLGRLVFRAVLDKDVATVMAVTLLGAVVTLMSLLLSDLAHRALDPRVGAHR